jgi:uncharacterized protein (DUF1778 family)
MKQHSSTYALRLPASIKSEAERIAAEDGTSLNQFIASAVAEKVAVLRTAEIFSRRRGQADFAAFEALMNRPTGAPVVPGDELPKGYARPSANRPER